jgi:hypothetical protein
MRATMPHKKSTALATARDQPANRVEGHGGRNGDDWIFDSIGERTREKKIHAMYENQQKGRYMPGKTQTKLTLNPRRCKTQAKRCIRWRNRSKGEEKQRKREVETRQE